jgi:hypothetical protein
MLSPQMINEIVSKLEKCIFSWSIVKVETKSIWECIETKTLNISWDKGKFKIDIQKILTDSFCEYDLIWTLYGETTPKVWDKVDFLIWKWWNNPNNFEFTLLSDEKVWEWEYKLISWDTSTWNFEICKPNYIFVEDKSKNIEFLQILCLILWIVVLILISIIIILLKKHFIKPPRK